MGINGAIFLTPNREKGYPIIGVFFCRITDRLKCAKNEGSLFMLRAPKEGRPDWRRVGRGFHRIFRKSRASHQKNGALFATLIAHKDIPLSESFPARQPTG